MKTFVPSKQHFITLMLVIVSAASGVNLQAQTAAPNLTFSGSSLYSGTAGNVGATYRFPSVSNDMDAFVKINARSSSSVKLEQLDITNTGFSKAFQPQISYNNGSVNTASDWWMEFEISFVNKNTVTPATVSEFKATALDIDGNNSRLKEWVSFYGLNAYTLEENSMLTVSSVAELVAGQMQNVGTLFMAPSNQYNGIDTAQTRVMTTVTYYEKSSFRLRIGGTTTGSASSTARMYSIWFRDFGYTAPVISTLPVKLVSFTAALNKAQSKADLKWVTASEINVSHFIVERSYDGANFSQAGIVFAYGNTDREMNYSFADNISNAPKPVVYYRLRSVDNDSKTQLSGTRIIRIGSGEEMLKMVTFPNPVTNELRVTLPSGWQGKPVLLELFNQNGQRVKTVSTGSASQTETIKVSDLAKGFYVVKASSENETARQKVIKH